MGAVFLLELDGGAGLSSNPRPSNCIFADLVVSVVAPSDEALVDVLARIEAFDDTIADLVPMRVDSTIFPSVELPLADSGAGEYECATGDFIAAEPLVLDKLGGAYALVRAHLENLERPPSELHGMLKFEAARSQALGDALGAFASHVYRLVRPSVGEADDLRILWPRRVVFNGIDCARTRCDFFRSRSSHWGRRRSCKYRGIPDCHGKSLRQPDRVGRRYGR